MKTDKAADGVFTIQAELQDGGQNSSDRVVDTFKCEVIPAWITNLKSNQVLEASDVEGLTDITFNSDMHFQSHVYDEEYDSNEEVDYPEQGCWL